MCYAWWKFPLHCGVPDLLCAWYKCCLHCSVPDLSYAWCKFPLHCTVSVPVVWCFFSSLEISRRWSIFWQCGRGWGGEGCDPSTVPLRFTLLEPQSCYGGQIAWNESEAHVSVQQCGTKKMVDSYTATPTFWESFDRQLFSLDRCFCTTVRYLEKGLIAMPTFWESFERQLFVEFVRGDNRRG